jgi:hypothetical protein
VKVAGRGVLAATKAVETSSRTGKSLRYLENLQHDTVMAEKNLKEGWESVMKVTEKGLFGAGNLINFSEMIDS